MDASLISPAVGWLSAAWLVALALQLADIGTARFDARLLARGTHTVVRLHAVAWVVPLAALVVVALWLGLDFAARLLAAETVVGAVLIAAALVALLVAAWLVVTVAVTRPAGDSYRAIRDELVDVAGTRVQQERLDEMRARLTALDEGNRGTLPAASSKRSAAGWVFRRPQRVVPPLLAVALLVVACVSLPDSPWRGWLVVATAAAIVLSAVLAVSGASASLALLAAVRDTQVEYRAEAAHLLAEAAKISKKPVAGLGERVARALQILREQQS